ncbi:zinc finger protein 774-like isoform X2 [Ischnura elegans]|uniref:zinc finger protein 774-like isoform X2 n=1 Tax=Ischnura elegans TaxID=197161 RepID=UPI001ED876D7|nr:zinc finger protein 774-like isoform X2 [Ischnura elegans]XP_046408055.1 zinc finger protein 774-like isoform X2 [Ischnura elegans]
MPRLPLYKLCRLCLCSSGELLDIFSETTDLEFTVGNALEDLLQVEISQEKNYPWLVCRTCLDKLSDFRLFKRRCLESLFVFNNRVRQSDFSRSNLASGVVKKTVKGESGKGLKMVRKALRETERAQGCDTAPSASGRDPEGDAVPSGRMTEGGNALGGPETNTIDACNAGISDRMSITVKDNAFDMDLSEEKYLAVPTGEELIRQGGGEPGSTADNSCEGSSFAEEELSVNQDGEVDDEVYKRHFMSSPSREEMPEDSEANVNSTSSYQARVQASGNREHGIGDQSPMDQDDGITLLRCSEATLQTILKVQGEDTSDEEGMGGGSRSGVIGAGKPPETPVPSPKESEIVTPRRGRGRAIEVKAKVSTVDSTNNRTTGLRSSRNSRKSSSVVGGGVSEDCGEVQGKKASNGSKPGYKQKRQRLLQCAECSMKFRTKMAVLIHVKEHKGIFKCFLCDLEFPSSDERSRHVEAEHRGEPLPNDSSEESDSRKGRSGDGSPKVPAPPKVKIKCKHCPKRFVRKEMLDAHFVLHTSDSPNKCTICSRTFPTASRLRSHVMIHGEEKPFACAKCPMSFKQKRGLQKHNTVVHLRKRPHSCTVCGKEFATRGAVRTHETTHSSEKPFACNQCSKSFGQKFQLKTHMSVHTGVKPYQCQYCPKSFGLKHYLRNHMATHTGVLEMQCRWCPDAFNNKADLWNHMNTVHKDYSVPRTSKTTQ